MAGKFPAAYGVPSAVSGISIPRPLGRGFLLERNWDQIPINPKSSGCRAKKKPACHTAATLARQQRGHPAQKGSAGQVSHSCFLQCFVSHLAHGCFVPNNCIDLKRYPLFMGRTVLQELNNSLKTVKRVGSCNTKKPSRLPTELMLPAPSTIKRCDAHFLATQLSAIIYTCTSSRTS